MSFSNSFAVLSTLEAPKSTPNASKATKTPTPATRDPKGTFQVPKGKPHSQRKTITFALNQRSVRADLQDAQDIRKHLKCEKCSERHYSKVFIPTEIKQAWEDRRQRDIAYSGGRKTTFCYHGWCEKCTKIEENAHRKLVDSYTTVSGPSIYDIFGLGYKEDEEPITAAKEKARRIFDQGDQQVIAYWIEECPAPDAHIVSYCLRLYQKKKAAEDLDREICRKGFVRGDHF